MTVGVALPPLTFSKVMFLGTGCNAVDDVIDTSILLAASLPVYEKNKRTLTFIPSLRIVIVLL